MEFGADRRARRMRSVNRAQQGGVLGVGAGEVRRQFSQHRQHGAVLCSLERPFERREAFGAERGQDVFFGPEIIEESALADVSRLGNVLDGGFHEAAFGKQAKRRTEKALPDFGAVAFAAAGLRQLRMPCRSCGGCHGGDSWSVRYPNTTISHIWVKVNAVKAPPTKEPRARICCAGGLPVRR